MTASGLLKWIMCGAPSTTLCTPFDVEWELISDLIGRIYECSLDPTLWDDTLSAIVAVLSPREWDVAMLVWERLDPPGGRFVAAVGVNSAVREVYLAVFAGKNPWSRAMMRQRTGRLIDTSDVIPPEDFRQSEMYQHFLKTWEIDRALAIVLDRQGDEKLGLLVVGKASEDVEGLKRGLRLLAPHIQRAVRIREHLRAANLRAASAEATLEQASSAVLTLTEDLALVYANPLALALAERGLFGVRQGRVEFHDPAAQQALDQLCRTPHSRSTAFSAEDAQGRRVNVLAARNRPGGGLEQATIVACLDLGDQAPLLDIDRLRAWFGFTPTEGRLAVALASGATLQDYVRRRNVSVAAGRYLLKSMFRKAEVNSQAQLVARLKALPALAP